MTTEVVIVTRVAVTWVNRTPSDEWLNRRLALMKATSIPSVLSVGGVTWVWLTCDRHYDRLQTEAANVPGALVVREGATTIPTEADRLVAVRIDSDDVLNPMLYREFAVAPPAVGELVEIMGGYQYDVRTQQLGRFTMRTRPPPIFAIGTNPANAIDVDRYHAWGRKPVTKRRLDWPGNFIQIIGHGNVLNKWRVPESDVLDEVQRRVVQLRFGFDLRNTASVLAPDVESPISGTL